jgi:V/A-type H+-transporting ATPase subunit I
MLRPERMSRVSVTGAKRVLDDVIETVHDLHLVHVSDYDGAWEGFEPGDPIAGADEAAERLVTVRSLQSILGIEEGTNGERSDVDVGDRLERVREEVNELDDRREELRDERRSLDERADAMAPLETLGIDLDLLSGYDSLETRVGEGNESEVRETLDAAEEVEQYETFSEGDAIAVFAQPASGASDVLEDALVGGEFAAIDVPDAEGTPEEYVADLDERRRDLDDDISDVESQLDDLRAEHAAFLLAAEEQLAIEVEKREAPLSFATTQNAFVAEGWIPTDRFGDLAAALHDTVGEHVEVEELERASYDSDGQVAEREPTESGDTGAGGPEPAADGGTDEEVRADGGETPMADSGPPVVQQNPGPVKPFEVLTRAVGQPNYTELDPTIIVSLTLPAFFGFMIGDVGYGLIYLFIGYFIYSQYDSDAFTSIGFVAMTAGSFTAVFGVLFGEIFGLHLVTQYLWEPLIGGAPLHKGLYPANIEWANAWFVIAALVGVFQLAIGYIFQFMEDFELHGLTDAILDSGSWLLALGGFWLFVFTRPPTTTVAGETVFLGPKPALLYEVFNTGPEAAFDLGFGGIPGLFTVSVPLVGVMPFMELVGVGMLVVGLGLLALGPTYELIEFHNVLAHPLSYLRISAELLAEVGLAFAVNLLFFGAYRSEGEFHLMLTHGSEYVLQHHEGAMIMFPGLVHGGIIAVLGGILVLIGGHLIVLALGVMSVGIQAIRLEYFEFFTKFYDGNGIPYSPFGHDRRFTADE